MLKIALDGSEKANGKDIIQLKMTNLQEQFDLSLKQRLIEMVAKKQKEKKAFDRTKESRSSVVNFKDCRPKQSLESQSMKPGETGFVKHVGQVKYIEKSNLKIEVQSKRAEAQTKDTDEYKLKELVEDQKVLFENLCHQMKGECEKEKHRKTQLLDNLDAFHDDLKMKLTEAKQTSDLLKSSQSSDLQSAKLRIQVITKQKELLTQERNRLQQEKDKLSKATHEEVRVAFAGLQKKKMEIALKEKGLSDKHEWDINNVKGHCSLQMSTQSNMEEVLSQRTQIYKQKTKELKQESRGQSIVMKNLMQEAKEDIEQCAEYCWKLEDAVNQGDFAMAKKIIREREAKGLSMKVREAGENIALMLREVEESKRRLIK
ncbi:hypothetical protein FGO68_gene4828 [Halteria grandinella]|uniref:Uncharacterized protein n=1 Tax=Halteria grandinella TaxID=5974 RepID=A0A8J8NYH0_HALGN|nr:hypothetical protein FGO68_gene4828 [Halteria grandinella]